MIRARLRRLEAAAQERGEPQSLVELARRLHAGAEVTGELAAELCRLARERGYAVAEGDGR